MEPYIQKLLNLVFIFIITINETISYKPRKLHKVLRATQHLWEIHETLEKTNKKKREKRTVVPSLKEMFKRVRSFAGGND